MNFFTPVTKPSKGTQETVKKVHVPWHKGTKGALKVSEETKAKLREANLGKKRSIEACARQSAAHTGKKHSEETLAKMRAKVFTEETRAKMSAAHKGRFVSDETRAKMSASLLARWQRVAKDKAPKPPKTKTHSAETRAKISDAWAARSKRVMTPLGVFASVREVAEAYDTHSKRVRYWINESYPDQYYYIKD